MHGLAVGGTVGAQIALFYLHDTFNPLILIILLIITGLVGSARMVLNAHTANQVYSGTLLGMFVVASYVMIRSV